MTKTEPEYTDDKTSAVDLFGPLGRYWRLIWQGTVVAVLLAVLIGGIYFIVQPDAWSATLGFRPLFDGASEGRYPNGLPFAASDLVADSIVSTVTEKNGIKEFCEPDHFESGLVVQETSAQLQFLTLDYQARLTDTRLTPIDRQRLQEEFTGRRNSLPREYELVFIRPQECLSLPQAVVAKVMTEVLEQWAKESYEKRGVMRMRAAILTPNVFDLPPDTEMSLFVKADLVRTAISRVIANISEVERMPGSELVRLTDSRVGLLEVRNRLEDIMHARLEPLIGVAGRGLGRDSIQWVTQALETAQAQSLAAEQRVMAYRQALREYSGVPTAATSPPRAGIASTPPSSDVQALTPQIDRTFIEGIVAMSGPNTSFRQEITRNVISTSMNAVDRAAIVEHYRTLLAAMNRPGAESMSPAELTRRLSGIIQEARESTRLFNQVYDEYSRISFRAGPVIYRTERPFQVTSLKAFSPSSYALLVILAMLVSPVVLAMVCLIYVHLRKLIRSMPTA